MAGVQGEGEGLVVLEGERLRVWAVSEFFEQEKINMGYISGVWSLTDAFHV
jgi:DNA topoisomerase VI subunit B